ncbi:phage antirepressor protein [archaeon]|nr:phage antirepressor protein [archaeon]
MNKIVVFRNQKIKRIWFKEEWYFSVVDIIAVLTESVDPTAYWRKLKQRLKKEGNETVTNCHALKMLAVDGKMRLTDVVNTKDAFRLIQSIPSKKVEPFKQWLAEVGSERIQEIENPELAQNRAKEYYELKGYPKQWIDRRLRGIAVRQELTDEWGSRDVKTKKEFAILTNEISKATFGKTVAEYKEFKRLQERNQNLRDHMTDFELIFTMLGEKTATEITHERDSKGFKECRDSAKEGGDAAKEARRSIEKRLGKSVISDENFLLKKKNLNK